MQDQKAWNGFHFIKFDFVAGGQEINRDFFWNLIWKKSYIAKTNYIINTLQSVTYITRSTKLTSIYFTIFLNSSYY